MSRPPKRKLEPDADAWLGEQLRNDPGCFAALRENRALAHVFKAMLELGDGAPFSAMLTRAKLIARRERRSGVAARDRLTRELEIYNAVERRRREGAPYDDNSAALGAYTLAGQDMHCSAGTARRAHDKHRALFEAADYSTVARGKRRAGFQRQKTHMT
jgi:hypothetical protein